MVTKSGTNVFHGDDFIFLEEGALDAETPFEIESRKPRLTRYRAGSSLGGPIKKGRTFFYGAFEQESNRSEAASDVNPQVASAVNQFLAAGEQPGAATRRITTGLFPTSRSETEAGGKLNQQIGSSGNLMLRYAFTGNREAGDAFNAGGLTDASARGNSSTSDSGLAGSLTSVPLPTVVNDLRFQIAGRRVSLRTNDTAGPGIDIGGLLDYGRPYFGNSRRNEDRYELGDTVAATVGRHLWKAGLTVNHVGLDASTFDGFGGIYIFGSLAEFFAFRPDTFRQAFGRAGTGYGVTNTGAFVQGHWSGAKRLTIDLGARYDYEKLPAGFHRGTDNLSPRVGVAYSPSDRWVLRSGFGLFFDRYVLADLNRAVQKNGMQGFEQAAQGRTAGTILVESQRAPLKDPATGIAPSIFRADPHRTASYSEQASLGVERTLTTNLTIRADYLFVRGVKLARTRNVNLSPPLVLTLQNAAQLGVSDPEPQQLGRDVFGPGRLDRALDSIYQLENSATSTYHGISLSLRRRLSNEVEFSGNYTLSKSSDDASRFDEQPQNPSELAAERAPSRHDQRQRFVFSGTFDLPFGDTDEDTAPSRGGKRPRLPERILKNVELAPIVTIQSGFHVDPLTGVDSNRSGAFPLSSRPLGFARDTLRMPLRATVDFRVLKYLAFGGPRRLDFVVEAFNLLNRVNVSGINSVWGNGLSPLPGFDQPIGAFDPRQVRFSIDFEF